MAEFSLQVLHEEIENDPEGLGYKINGNWKEDQDIADLINDPNLGATIQRQFVQPQEIIEQITFTDWDAISQSARLYIQLLPALSNISTIQDGTEVRANLLSIFGAGTDTRVNLINVVERPGSRAEVLWGEGKVVSLGEIGRAANL